MSPTCAARSPRPSSSARGAPRASPPSSCATTSSRWRASGVFAAPAGVAPAPIQSPLGWHLIRINKIEPGKITPFDQVKEKIEKDLKAQMAPDILIKLVTDFERALSKSQSMAKAAEEMGLKVKTYDNVDSRGQDAAGKQVVIGPVAAELVQAAFATRESSDSD